MPKLEKYKKNQSFQVCIGNFLFFDVKNFKPLMEKELLSLSPYNRS